MRRVQVDEYDPHWVSMYEEEAKKLKEVFDSEITAIHHIGSTSIKGLKAKPIIDIMIVVNHIYKIDEFNDLMKKLGYIAMGENGIPRRRFFQKGGDQRSHHVHMFENGSSDVIRHLAFRDYLRNNPDVSREYSKIKERLAKNYPHDIKSYIEGKEKIDQKIERAALDWYNNNLKFEGKNGS